MVSDVLILGGGLAGASAALELAQARIPVRLIERESGPHHKVCGEFLSIEAQRDLRRLGLDPLRLGAVAIDRVRLVRGNRRAEATLPFVAQGVSRMDLDEALLEAAQREGAQVERGIRVNRLEGTEAGTSAGPCRAETVLLATGKHDLRGVKRAAQGAGADHVGFKMHWRLPPRQAAELSSAIELIVFDGGYAGLQRITDATANLCLIVRRSRLAGSGGHWNGLLADLLHEPHIARRLGDAEPLFERPLTIANLPYGYRCDPAVTASQGSLFRLGDQAAVTAPLTGDGMAIALRSARLASACLRTGAGPEEYHRRLRTMVSPQIGRAMFLHRMTGNALAMQLALSLSALCPPLLGSLARMTRLAESPA